MAEEQLPDFPERWLPHGGGSSPPPPGGLEPRLSEVEDSVSLLDGIELLSDGGGTGVLTPSINPRRRRLLLTVATGTAGVLVLIIALSVLVSSRRSLTSKDSATTPESLAQQPGHPDKEAPIRQSTNRTTEWALRMYDVPVPAVPMPPYSVKVRPNQQTPPYQVHGM